MSRWPIQRGPFRPLNRSQRMSQILQDAMQRVRLSDDDGSLDNLHVDLAVRIRDDALGLPDGDRETAALVARQLSEALRQIGDELAGSAVLV
jgi:hypothetical protein